MTWHYRRADPEYGKYQAQECEKELQSTVVANYDVEVMKGKANLEVRPRFVNKGEIVKRLIGEGGGDVDAPSPLTSLPPGADNSPADAFYFCLGDDHTDEDMFKALNESSLPKECVFTCTVGPSSKQTAASYHLLEPSDVISTIAMLNGATDDVSNGALSITEGETTESR